MSLGVKFRPFPLTLHVGLTTSAACDKTALEVLGKRKPPTTQAI